MTCTKCGKNHPTGLDFCPDCRAASWGVNAIWSSIATCGFIGFLFGLAGGDAWSEFGWTLAGVVVGTLVGAKFAGDYRKLMQTLTQRALAQSASQSHARARVAVAATPSGSYQAIPASTPTTHPGHASDFIAATLRNEAEMIASGLYRKCPYCAEVIKKEAVVCRFCKRDIVSDT